MYGFGARPGMASLGFQYPNSSAQFYHQPYNNVPPSAVNDSSLVFPSATQMKLGTGVTRPVFWASSFQQSAPAQEVVESTSPANQADRNQWFAPAAAASKSEVFRVNGDVYDSTSFKQETSWTAIGSSSNDRFYSTAVPEVAAASSLNVDCNGPDNPYVARVCVGRSEQPSTMDRVDSRQEATTAKARKSSDWSACEPVTMTVYGNDSETDCGRQSSTPMPRDVTEQIYATKLTTASNPSTFTADRPQIHRTHGNAATDDVSDDEHGAAAFVEFDGDHVRSIPASVGSTREVKSQDVVCARQQPINIDRWRQGDANVGPQQSASLSGQQQQQVRDVATSRHAAAGFQQPANAAGWTGDAPANSRRFDADCNEEFETRLPKWTGDANRKQNFEAVQSLNARPNVVASDMGIRSQSIFWPLDKGPQQVVQQQQQQLLQHQPQTGEPRIQAERQVVVTAEVHRMASQRPADVARSAVSPNGKELITDAFKFLDEFEDS